MERLVRLLILTAWVLTGNTALAQAPRSIKEIIADLETRRNNALEFKMPFTHQRTSSLLTQPQTRSGSVFFHHEDGIVIHYQQPQSYALLLSGNIAYMLQTNKIEKMNMEQHPMFTGLSDFFHADFSMLEKHFEVTDLQDTPPLIQLTLQPKRKMGIAKLQLTINEQHGTIEQFVIEESSGDKQVMDFGQPVIQPIDQKLFTLTHWTSPELAKAYEPAPR